MAIYHLSVKAVSRSAGRSATAAAAYRAGCEITDQRTGEVHDYTRKGGVESADIVLPDGAPDGATDRAALWNAAEAAERRKDACVAREFEVALPDELSPAERRRLAVDFAKEMANREGCAVDVAVHAPGKEGDSRNHHAHILRTT
ncbi:MobQ family relaxase, partial [Pseudomonas aeruginosa]|uniref:MobQ family relaxase n=1 Tax=Pseudomonas aeruginosa TaxID=287 RepID=UPI003896D308